VQQRVQHFLRPVSLDQVDRQLDGAAVVDAQAEGSLAAVVSEGPVVQAVGGQQPEGDIPYLGQPPRAAGKGRGGSQGVGRRTTLLADQPGSACCRSGRRGRNRFDMLGNERLGPGPGHPQMLLGPLCKCKADLTLRDGRFRRPRVRYTPENKSLG
jgi:hypothetical protein